MRYSSVMQVIQAAPRYLLELMISFIVLLVIGCRSSART